MSEQRIFRNAVERGLIAMLSALLGGGPSFAQEKAPGSAAKETVASGPAAAKAEVAPAISGYCPVSYFTDAKAMKGDPNYHSEYEGLVYFFADAEKKAKFDKDPSKYVPHLGGLCAVALGGPYGNRFYGDPTVFAVVSGKLYFMSSERAKRSFDQKPDHYAERGEAIYKTPALGGHCPVKYQTDSIAAPGDSKYLQFYRGFAYALSGEEAVEKFNKAPERYVPAFNAYCALGVSEEKEHPADPSVFAVVDGKTYFFFDQASKDKCLSRSPSCIAEAEQNWPKMAKKIYRVPGQ